VVTNVIFYLCPQKPFAAKLPESLIMAGDLVERRFGVFDLALCRLDSDSLSDPSRDFDG